jgi:hypothetical protein
MMITYSARLAENGKDLWQGNLQETQKIEDSRPPGRMEGCVRLGGLFVGVHTRYVIRTTESFLQKVRKA